MTRRKLITICGILLALVALACDNYHLPAGPNAYQVRVKAYAKVVPYEVIIDVYDANGAHEGKDEIVTTTESAWSALIEYDPGTKLRIRVEVKPPHPGSSAFCEIWDGTAHVVNGPMTEGWRAICNLTTSR